MYNTNFALYFQPGAPNALDMGLERPNSFSSRVTLVSDTVSFVVEMRFWYSHNKPDYMVLISFLLFASGIV